jgi:hypothetical protein
VPFIRYTSIVLKICGGLIAIQLVGLLVFSFMGAGTPHWFAVVGLFSAMFATWTSGSGLQTRQFASVAGPCIALVTAAAVNIGAASLNKEGSADLMVGLGVFLLACAGFIFAGRTEYSFAAKGNQDRPPSDA